MSSRAFDLNNEATPWAPSDSNPVRGYTLSKNLVGANEGDAWTGFEWVTPERYEQIREESPWMNLPPLQPVAPAPLPGKGAQVEDPRGGVADQTFSVPLPPYAPPFLSPAPYAEGAPWRKAHDSVRYLLRHVMNENPDRGGLLETPDRWLKAWEHWTSGYAKNPADILKVFEDGAEGCDEMVVVRDIPIYSKCEHHLADIFGTATIGYLPDGKIVGLSKLNRLADMFARRLQVQERMTNQIADALMTHLGPVGCGVVITARHMCMESRGVQQGSNTTTSALRGNFKTDPTVRNEFLSLANRR